jgi:hypothetical protein
MAPVWFCFATYKADFNPFVPMHVPLFWGACVPDRQVSVRFLAALRAIVARESAPAVGTDRRFGERR